MATPNTRNVRVALEAASWAPNQPPPSLVAAAGGGPYDINLDAALLFVGIWTRPPTRPGFTLADCWAWLRYFPAFSPATPMQLCHEWSDIDPHQKTVASDELGVGLTTWVLHRTLGFQRYSDTNWVINVLAPGQWGHRSRARRGPAKSPDYIAEDAAGGLSVVECKGTQTSLAELHRAVSRGLPQKENVVPRGGNTLIHSLVAGAFVPQWSSHEPATILIVDPEWRAITDELRKYTAEDIRSTTEQVAYAKELSIFDLSEAAASLVKASGDPVRPASALERDLSVRRQAGALEGNTVRFTRDHFWRTPFGNGNEDFVGVRFKGSLDLDRLEPIRRPAAQTDARESIAEATGRVTWGDTRTDQGTRLTSPIGAEYEIEWLTRS